MVTTTALPTTWRQALRRHSPIEARDRQRIEQMMRRLDQRPPTRDTMQGVADTLRPAFERVILSMTAGALELGTYFLWIKERTPHGLFLTLFKDSPEAIDTPLALSSKKAQALMRFAQHPVIANPKNWKALPMDQWRNLDELTRVAPADLQAAIDRGTVHTRMPRTAILALRSGATAAPATEDPLARVRVAVRLYRREGHGIPALREYLQEILADLEHERDQGGDIDDDGGEE